MSKQYIGPSILEELWEYIKMIIFVVVVVFIVNNVLLINAKIPSESMEDTIMTGDRIFGNRLAYINKDPQRFDIVIFKYPDDETQLFIKRVIGLPGETVEIRDGKVYIDGSETPLDDSFTPESPRATGDRKLCRKAVILCWVTTETVPRIPVFGPITFVKKEKILGKAVLRYFPSPKLIK